MRADRLDLVVFALALLLIGPTVLWLAEMVVSRFSQTAFSVLHAGLLGVLFGLVVWQAVDSSSGGPLAYLVILVVAILVAVFYLRSQFPRTMVGLMSFATPVVLIAFWFTGPGASIVLPQKATTETGPGNGTPVVMVVLDEFPLAAIEKAPGKIDVKEFPNFGMLARQGTWYSNAHTKADVTQRAVPGLLAGRIADSGSAAPDARKYPDNLFTLMDAAGYEVDAAESITDLCRHDICPERGYLKSRLSRMLIDGSTAGQPLPGGLALDLEEPLRESAIELEPSPQIRANSFIENLEPENNRLSYTHLLLPHIPWIYLPDGHNYPGPIATGLSARSKVTNDQSWTGPRAEVDSDFQRMSLQTAYSDRVIGRVIRKMKAQGSWDKALFVVVADHGASYAKGQGRRYLNRKNAGWVLPVPMFVKYPDQKRGRIDRKAVNSFDVLPTILETTGIQVPDSVEGVPLDGATPQERTVSSLSSAVGDFTIGREALRRASDEAARYRNEVFPDGSLYALAGHAGSLGTKTGDIRGLVPVDANFDSPWPRAPVSTSLDQIPAYVSGSIKSRVDDRTPLLISLNGRIAGTFRSWTEDGDRRFAFTLPPGLFLDGLDEVRLFKFGR